LINAKASSFAIGCLRKFGVRYAFRLHESSFV
jgi:hypothetical protein